MSTSLPACNTDFRQQMAELLARIESLPAKQRVQLQILASDMERNHLQMQCDCAKAQQNIADMEAAEKSVKSTLHATVARMQRAQLN